MPLSSALRFLGVWSGTMALAGSGAVYGCLQTIYGLNSGAFLSTLLHMPYPNRGVVWRSVQSVFTRPLPRLLLFFCPPGYVHLYVAYHQPISAYGLFPPPPARECESEYAGASSRRIHALTSGPAWTST